MQGILGRVHESFGSTKRMAPYLTQISRCLSYHAPICRPHALLQCRHSKQWKRSIDACWQSQLLQPLSLPMSMPSMVRVQLYSHRPTNVFTFNANMNMLRKRISFSGTPGSVGMSDKDEIVPVGVITPDTQDGKNLKIVIVPLDLAGMDAEMLKHTLESINMLRKYAHEIDVFTSSMIEDYHEMCEANAESSLIAGGNNPPSTDELNFWDAYNAPSNTEVDAVGKTRSSTQNADVRELRQATASAATIANVEWGPMPTTTPSLPHVAPAPNVAPSIAPGTVPQQQPVAFPHRELKPAEQGYPVNSNMEEIDAGTSVDEINISVPESLESRLNELAISSMQLSFEMDMTNIRDAMASHDGEMEGITDGHGNDSTMSMQTKVELDGGYKPENTLPLAFNAQIRGTVEIDADKLKLSDISEQQLPDFNDNVTAIAANICSTALQRGFPAELGHTMTTDKCDKPDKKTDGGEDKSKYIKCVGKDGKGCVSPGNADLPKFEPQQDEEKCEATTNMTRGATVGTAPTAGIKSSAEARMALKRSQALKHMKYDHKRPRKIDEGALLSDESTMKTRTMATAAQPEIYEDDFDPSMGKRGGGGGCTNPVIKPKKKCPGKCPLLDDPCKPDPCKKSNKGKKSKKGKKKSNKKKAVKTQEIRASAGKGGGSCGKGDEKKKDPCAKKGEKDGKKDPCAKFKKGGKDDGGDKKKDPCAKFKKGGKDGKKDPCAKFKKGGKDGGCGKKKDPCAKFKKGGKGDKKCYSTFTSAPLSSYKARPHFQIYSTRVRRHYVNEPRKPRFGGPVAQNVKDKKPLGPRFLTYSTLLRRHYSKRGKREEDNKKKHKKPKKEVSGKCRVLVQAMPLRRGPDQKARTSLRDDCFDKDECPKVHCTGNCAKVPKRRKKCEPKTKTKTIKAKKAKKSQSKACGLASKKMKKPKEDPSKRGRK